ncbi:MAG: hypothetical protein IKX19_00630 [Clostridia bacterium]|nr:hypothetical protein [Clostridia bacterium]
MKETARIEEDLRRSNLDPEIIGMIRYRIEKVTEAGGIPEKKESVLGRLDQLKAEAEEQKRQGAERKKPVIG